MLHILPLWSPT